MVKSVNAVSEGKSRLTLGFSRFLTWWWSEIAAMVPVRLRYWWRESDRVLFLTFDDKKHALIEHVTIGGREILKSIDMDSVGQTIHGASLEQELLRRMNGNYRLLLCLAKEKVLRQTVSLPLVAEENLRQTLGFEIDRYTPFKADQVYFDYRIKERDSTHRKLVVELVLTKKERVDKELADAATLGLHASGVISADDMLSQASLNLLPEAVLGKPKWQMPWSRVFLASFAVLLLIAFLGIPIWQKRTAAIGLMQPLQEVKAKATETDKMRERLDTMVADYNLLPDKKWQDFSPLLALAELSKLLPEDTFVTVLDYDGKTIQIQGESASAASLVETIDASPMFKDVSFKAQVTKIQGTSNDRFHLSAILDAGARPKRTTLDPMPDPGKSPGGG